MKWDRQGVCALLTAVCVLTTAAFSPAAPRAAWWCTAFSIICRETADGCAAETPVQLRWKVAEWWSAWQA